MLALRANMCIRTVLKPTSCNHANKACRAWAQYEALTLFKQSGLWGSNLLKGTIWIAYCECALKQPVSTSNTHTHTQIYDISDRVMIPAADSQVMIKA